VNGQVSQRQHKQPVITKIQAAEQQLDTSIRLFFENIDYLSACTLAAASREITDDLCQKKKHELFREETARLGDPLKVHLSFREEMGIMIKPEFLNDAVKLFRKRQNFLKHAEKDPNGTMDELSAHELAFVIFWAIKNFALLEKRLTPAMSTFLGWFGAAEPKVIEETEWYPCGILQIYSRFARSLSRSLQQRDVPSDVQGFDGTLSAR